MMENKTFKELLKRKKADEILEEYMSGDINLTYGQIQMLINKKERKGRGKAVIGLKKEGKKNERSKKNK